MFGASFKKKTLLGIWLLSAVLIVIMVGYRFVRGTKKRRSPDIVFISIDTLRADRMGLYGNRRDTSPVIDEYARNSIVYRNALSQAPWTLPSTASFVTSLYPSQHGAIKIGRRLNTDVDTIAEVLHDAGYHTIGVVSHTVVSEKYNFDQGFDLFDQTHINNQRTVTSDKLSKLAIGHFRERPKDKPCFMWVHYFDPHFDYIRHPEFGFADDTAEILPSEFVLTRYSAGDPRRMYKKSRMKSVFLEHIRAVYDEEIAFTDLWVGDLLDAVTADDADTVFIITADHGEYFMERGRFLHDGDVYNELVHVPLIIGGAIDDALRGKKVARTVELISLPKTMAGIAKVEKDPFNGEDLIALASEKTPKPRFAYSEGTWAWQKTGRTAGVVYKGWKLIRNFDDERYELYDTGKDRKEKKDLFQSGDPETVKMRRLLKKKLDAHVKTNWHIDSKAEKVDVTEEEKAQLRALGYVK